MCSIGAHFGIARISSFFLVKLQSCLHLYPAEFCEWGLWGLIELSLNYERRKNFDMTSLIHGTA
jgi:hypothetical protein